MELDYEQIYIETGTRLPVEDARFLYEQASAINAKTILEIGAGGGGSSIVLGTVAKENDGHLYSIEPKPEGRWLPNITKYGLVRTITLIKGFSPWVAFEMPELDLLFIDGNHELQYCLCDYHYWQKYVRPGGIVVFHDHMGNCAEDKRRSKYGRPDYIPLVQRAINIILETDELIPLGCSYAVKGGATAYQKPKSGKDAK